MLETIRVWKSELDSQKDSVESEHMELTMERGRLEGAIEGLSKDIEESAGEKRALLLKIEACEKNERDKKAEIERCERDEERARDNIADQRKAGAARHLGIGALSLVGVGAAALLPGFGIPIALACGSAAAGTAGMVGNAVATTNVIQEAKKLLETIKNDRRRQEEKLEETKDRIRNNKRRLDETLEKRSQLSESLARKESLLAENRGVIQYAP